jgi:nucleotide-binding universal stress UspA family protein
MSDTYLVAVDGSAHGWKALDLATKLAQASGAALLVVHVVPFQPMTSELEVFAKSEGLSREEVSARFNTSRRIGERIVGEAEARVKRMGFSRISSQVAEGNPVEEIVGLAKSADASMIFVGSRGLSDISEMLIGGVSHQVLHLAPCSCVAVK